ncbi:MAG: oligosaccharide flippase family protein, partial [Gemmatimonadota bacterium]|nr:oligosaccharide flippase family protein [Gemmatimonadota bacterium]
MLELLRSRTARNSGFNLLGLAIPLVIGLLVIPITLHGLGAARFGLLSLSLTVLEYSTLFALGLGPATTKHVAEAIARKDESTSDLVVMSVIGHAVLGTVGGAIVALLAPVFVDHVFTVVPSLRTEAIAVFRLLGLMVPATLLLLSLFGALEGASRFGLVNLLRVPISALSFIIPAVGVTHGVGLPAILSTLVILRLIVCGVLALVVAASVPGYEWKWPSDWNRMRPLLSFGAWLSVSNVVSPTLVYADRFLLGHLRGLGPLGLYSAPFDGLMRLLAVPSSLVRAMFPTLSALHHVSARDELRPLFRRAVAAVLLLLGGPVLILVVFGPFLLRLWLGEQVAVAAGTAVRILAVGLIFNAVAFVPTTF